MMVVIILIVIGGMIIAISQLIPRPFIPAYQKITLPDGQLLEGPDDILGCATFGTVCR